MPRILGVDLPAPKPAWVALTHIHGIGPTSARKALMALGINPSVRTRELTEDEVSRIGAYIEKNHVIEGQLRRQVAQNIQRLKDIGCYRGMRHRRSLPARGQRTRSNARTRKGPRKTVAGKKSVKEMGH
jgi:small subunit ribosomal protein S13